MIGDIKYSGCFCVSRIEELFQESTNKKFANYRVFVDVYFSLSLKLEKKGYTF